MSILSEYVAFLRQHKRYWLLPLLVILIAMITLIVLGDTSDIAPLLYAGDGGS